MIFGFLKPKIAIGEVMSDFIEFILHLTESEYDTRPFYGGVAHKSRLVRGRCKIFLPLRHSFFRRATGEQAINLVLHAGKDLRGRPLEAKV